jgi:drug/metabolite transporter (DMT)-like permease|tara:strand:+ start:5384 stop:6250 length:867 start_codon:yes stop_codon:yes gene_type:complete
MHKETNIFLGISFLMLGLFIVPFNDAVAKVLSADLNIMEVIWSRFFGHFIFLVPIAFFIKGKDKFINANTNPQILRGLFIFGGTSFFFLSIKYIPLVNALCLLLIAPIIVVLCSSIFLKEKLSFLKVFCVTVGFIGTIFIIQPGLKGFDVNSIYALISGACYACYIMYTRKLNLDSDPIVTLSFTAIPGALIMTLLLPFYWEHVPSLNQMLIIGSFGPIVIAAHFCIIKAYQFAEASVLAPIHYFEIVSNVMISVIYFKDIPSILTSIGIMCIISSGVLISLKGLIYK